MFAETRTWAAAFCLVVSLSVTILVGGCAAEKRTANAIPAATVKVAAIQCSSDLGEVEKNREKLTSLVREAASIGAKIVVLPETAVTGYLSQDLKTNWHVDGWPIEAAFKGRDPATAAETVPGPSTEHFCDLARELQIYLTIPLLERVGDLPSVEFDAEGESNASPAEEPKYFNTVC